MSDVSGPQIDVAELLRQIPSALVGRVSEQLAGIPATLAGGLQFLANVATGKQFQAPAASALATAPELVARAFGLKPYPEATGPERALADYMVAALPIAGASLIPYVAQLGRVSGYIKAKGPAIAVDQAANIYPIAKPREVKYETFLQTQHATKPLLMRHTGVARPLETVSPRIFRTLVAATSALPFDPSREDIKAISSYLAWLGPDLLEKWQRLTSDIPIWERRTLANQFVREVAKRHVPIYVLRSEIDLDPVVLSRSLEPQHTLGEIYRWEPTEMRRLTLGQYYSVGEKPKRAALRAAFEKTREHLEVYDRPLAAAGALLEPIYRAYQALGWDAPRATPAQAMINVYYVPREHMIRYYSHSQKNPAAAFIASSQEAKTTLKGWSSAQGPRASVADLLIESLEGTPAQVMPPSGVLREIAKSRKEAVEKAVLPRNVSHYASLVRDPKGGPILAFSSETPSVAILDDVAWPNQAAAEAVFNLQDASIRDLRTLSREYLNAMLTDPRRQVAYGVFEMQSDVEQKPEFRPYVSSSAAKTLRVYQQIDNLMAEIIALGHGLVDEARALITRLGLPVDEIMPAKTVSFGSPYAEQPSGQQSARYVLAQYAPPSIHHYVSAVGEPYAGEHANLTRNVLEGVAEAPPLEQVLVKEYGSPSVQSDPHPVPFLQWFDPYFAPYTIGGNFVTEVPAAARFIKWLRTATTFAPERRLWRTLLVLMRPFGFQIARAPLGKQDQFEFLSSLADSLAMRVPQDKAMQEMESFAAKVRTADAKLSQLATDLKTAIEAVRHLSIRPWGMDYRDVIIRDAIVRADSLGFKRVAFAAGNTPFLRWYAYLLRHNWFVGGPGTRVRFYRSPLGDWEFIPDHYLSGSVPGTRYRLMGADANLMAMLEKGAVAEDEPFMLTSFKSYIGGFVPLEHRRQVPRPPNFTAIYDGLFLDRLVALLKAAGKASRQVLRPAIMPTISASEELTVPIFGGAYVIELDPDIVNAMKIASADDREERAPYGARFERSQFV